MNKYYLMQSVGIISKAFYDLECLLTTGSRVMLLIFDFIYHFYNSCQNQNHLFKLLFEYICGIRGTAFHILWPITCEDSLIPEQRCWARFFK